jgi:hypothetical protein
VNALPSRHCFITAAGDLAAPITRILHLVAANDNSDVRACTLACLEAADTHDSGIVSITIPFFSEIYTQTCIGILHNRWRKLF